MLDHEFNRSASFSAFLKRFPQESVEWLENFLEKNSWAVHARDADGVTGLQVAAGLDQIDKAQIFLELGADANNRNNFGTTVLMSAHLSPYQTRFPGFPSEMVVLLLDHDADPSVKDRFGRTLGDMARVAKDEQTLAALKPVAVQAGLKL